MKEVRRVKVMLSAIRPGLIDAVIKYKNIVMVSSKKRLSYWF